MTSSGRLARVRGLRAEEIISGNGPSTPRGCDTKRMSGGSAPAWHGHLARGGRASRPILFTLALGAVREWIGDEDAAAP